MSGHLKKLRVVDPVLSKLAQGYSNAQFIGNNVLKVVPMAKEAGEVPTFGDEAFVIEDSERGVGGQRKRIKTNPANMTPVVLHEHSLEDVVDDREKEEAFYNIAQRKQRVVQNKLGLELEVKQATVLMSASTYDASNKTSLSGNQRWDIEHEDSNPIAVLNAAAGVVRGRIGRKPTDLTIGDAAWAVLQNHPALRNRLGASDIKLVTVELFISLFPWLKRVHIGEAVYKSGSLKKDVWGKNVALTYVPDHPAEEEPAFGYTFRKSGRPRTVKYREERVNGDVIGVEDMYEVKVVGKGAGYLIQDVIS